MSHHLQLPRREVPLGSTERSEAGRGAPHRIFSPSQLLLPPPSPSALSSCLLSCSFQRLPEPATGSPGLPALLTLFQMARIKVSMGDEKSNQQALPTGWTGEEWECVCTPACASKRVHTCANALRGPRTKSIPSTSLQSPTLRLRTPLQSPCLLPRVRHWGSGDGGGKAGPAPPPWDVLKTLSEPKRNTIATAASPSGKPNPDYRAELEEGGADQSLL